MRVLDEQGNEIELKDDEDDGYQPIRDDLYDRDEEFSYHKDEAEFAEAGFGFKGENDDDDLTLDLGEDASDDEPYADDEY